jgi:hypothetical protein
MSSSKKISVGFQVVDTRTGAALSSVFQARAPARAAAARLYADGIPSGVRHLEEYVDARATFSEIATTRADALKRAEAAVDRRDRTRSRR